MTDPLTIVRLEKAAIDNGFDRALERVGDWHPFESTHAPLKVWLSRLTPDGIFVALSREDVCQALLELGVPVAVNIPDHSAACLCVENIVRLNQLLRRAYQLARTLPNELLHTFIDKTAPLPRRTEAERLVIQRVGQDIFREGLLEFWEGKCAVTGLAVPELLRASHIKPWAACATDAERLDVFNGFLLAPHLDAAFDAGFITVARDGTVIVSGVLTPAAREVLGLTSPLKVRQLADGHRQYLLWHREREFKSA